MNSVIKPFLDSHIKAYELIDNEPSAFEHLVNYLAVRNYTSRHFDPSEITLGKGEVGIDGVAIIVNDTLITSYDQITDFLGVASDVSVSFVFVQSKTSETFDASALSHFFTAVNDFLTAGKINMNSKASEMRKISKYIMEHPTQLSKNPDCHLFFAFTGKENEDATRTAIVNQQIEVLKRTSIFDEVTFSLFDSEKIVSVCRSIKNNIRKTMEMVDCAVLPRIHNVSEAYIGIVRCTEYIKLITNDEGAIISNLFEDNIRYFQGQNIINAEIQSTLRTQEKQEEFSVLNNGVTIVAKEMRRTGNYLTLSNFQIINGCQTSFVLYENRNRIVDDSYVIIKLISTTNKDISDSIVKATNRQTPVLNEAFETLRDFHKNLENVYASYPIKDRLFYERRSKQYDSDEINKNKIISFPFQTAAYVAVFLNEPQSTHRYYGELLKSYIKRMYNDNDVLEQYCMASMCVYVVDRYLRRSTQYAEMKKYRFHLAFILRILALDAQLPEPNSRAMKKYCDELYLKINDEEWVVCNVERGCKIVTDIVAQNKVQTKDGNDLTRTREFTAAIIKELGLKKSSTTSNPTQLPPLRKGEKVNCKVLNWNNSFVYVEMLDYKESGSIHVKFISGQYIVDIGEILKEGQEVKATLLESTPHPVFGFSLSML